MVASSIEKGRGVPMCGVFLTVKLSGKYFPPEVGETRKPGKSKYVWLPILDGAAAKAAAGAGAPAAALHPNS